jgi:hypothetical protein
VHPRGGVVSSLSAPPLTVGLVALWERKWRSGSVSVALGAMSVRSSRIAWPSILKNGAPVVCVLQFVNHSAPSALWWGMGSARCRVYEGGLVSNTRHPWVVATWMSPPSQSLHTPSPHASRAASTISSVAIAIRVTWSRARGRAVVVQSARVKIFPAAIGRRAAEDVLRAGDVRSDSMISLARAPRSYPAAAAT